jgi:ATP:cob(I)alamin adenosyltransferase
MTSIYTKGGDGGSTGLLGGSRVSKAALRVECYGAIDEANSSMGLARALSEWDFVKLPLKEIQSRLFVFAAEVAGDAEGVKRLKDRIDEEDVAKLEHLIDRCMAAAGEMHSFVTPGEDAPSAALHVARTVARRAERLLIRLAETEDVRAVLIKYANRLSDALYALARIEEVSAAAVSEIRKDAPALEKQGDGPAAQDAAPAKVRQISSIDLASAESVAALCIQEAEKMGVPVVVSVVDNGGNVILQKRMDGAFLASLDISLNKAFTAVALQMPTHKVRDMALPGSDTYGIQLSNGGRITPFGGGFPLVESGMIVGGLGISGGSVEEDMRIASAALRGPYVSV